ncbi:MAG TPA: hypothetical protein VN653_04445 [Anaerolineales bacterium]|nr:hypothetical protein [Anaerolineales bacterium]
MPPKRVSPKKPAGQIRVLIVDDDELVRRAWRKVLNGSGQIRVIGEVDPGSLGKFTIVPEPPEIIVAGYSLLKAGYWNRSRLQSLRKSRPKVLLIVETKEQLKTAFKNRVDFAVAKPFDSPDLITWVRMLSDDAKRLCAEYHDQLSIIGSGPSQNGQYYELVSNILQLLLHPDLVNPEDARPPAAVPLAGRLVFQNRAHEHKFWIDARGVHASKYLTIDIYNEKLIPNHIRMLGKYLSESHGMLGIVVGRTMSPVELNAVATALYDNERKMVLPLDDTQLRAMLEYKAGGVNPVFELERLYQKLVANAGN